MLSLVPNLYLNQEQHIKNKIPQKIVTWVKVLSLVSTTRVRNGNLDGTKKNICLIKSLEFHKIKTKHSVLKINHLLRKLTRSCYTEQYEVTLSKILVRTEICMCLLLLLFRDKNLMLIKLCVCVFCLMNLRMKWVSKKHENTQFLFFNFFQTVSCNTFERSAIKNLQAILNPKYEIFIGQYCICLHCYHPKPQ